MSIAEASVPSILPLHEGLTDRKTILLPRYAMLPHKNGKVRPSNLPMSISRSYCCLA